MARSGGAVKLPNGRGSAAAGANVGKPPTPKFYRGLGETAWGAIFLSPWLLGLGLFLAGPTLYSLYLSFTDFNLVRAPEWVGFENYSELFTEDRRYANALGVTFRYVLFGVPLNLIFALALALMLNAGIRGLGLYRAMFYVPSLLGGSVAISILWRQVFGYEGLFSSVLEVGGVTGSSWISDPSMALWTLIILHVWQFGSPMIIFLAGLKQIPRELYEAAELDGAGPVKSFFLVTLPMLTPIVFFNLILQVINAFQAFTPAYIVSGGTGGPLDSTLFYTLYLYLQGFTAFKMGYASAMGWILLMIIAVMSALLFLTSRFWVFYDDAK